MRRAISFLMFVLFLCSAISVIAEEPQKVYADDIIIFGNYEQDNDLDNGPEPIEWIVLDVQDGKALLLSRYGLYAKSYNTKLAIVTWETCTLRAWLNSDFLNQAFNAEEQSAILTTTVDNSAGQCYSGWSTDGGNNTQDKIFLLSYKEADRYLGVKYWEDDDGNNTKSRVSPTYYAIQNGAWVSDSQRTSDSKPIGWWWLRSPGSPRNRAAIVIDDGSLHLNSVLSVHGVVRPALWIDLNSGIF